MSIAPGRFGSQSPGCASRPQKPGYGPNHRDLSRGCHALPIVCLPMTGDATSSPSYPQRVFSMACGGTQVGQTARLFGVIVLRNLCDRSPEGRGLVGAHHKCHRMAARGVKAPYQDQEPDRAALVKDATTSRSTNFAT
jgi:hypothetical protein